MNEEAIAIEQKALREKEERESHKPFAQGTLGPSDLAGNMGINHGLDNMFINAYSRYVHQFESDRRFVVEPTTLTLRSPDGKVLIASYTDPGVMDALRNASTDASSRVYDEGGNNLLQNI